MVRRLWSYVKKKKIRCIHVQHGCKITERAGGRHGKWDWGWCHQGTVTYSLCTSLLLEMSLKIHVLSMCQIRLWQIQKNRKARLKWQHCCTVRGAGQAHIQQADLSSASQSRQRKWCFSQVLHGRGQPCGGKDRQSSMKKEWCQEIVTIRTTRGMPLESKLSIYVKCQRKVKT